MIGHVFDHFYVCRECGMTKVRALQEDRWECDGVPDAQAFADAVERQPHIDRIQRVVDDVAAAYGIPTERARSAVHRAINLDAEHRRRLAP